MDSMDKALITSLELSESIAVDEMLAKMKGTENYKRVVAFTALDSERKYQERLHNLSNQEQLSIPGELVLLRSYLRKAEEAYAVTFGDPGEKPTMDIVRKIGAIALRCMENYGSIMRDSKQGIVSVQGRMDCKLYLSAFSGEVDFQVDMVMGQSHEGSYEAIAPKHCVMSSIQPTKAGVDGQIKVHILGNVGEETLVRLPDGQTITVSADKVHAV